MSTELFPRILDLTVLSTGVTFPLDAAEQRTLVTARKLFDANFFPQSLLELWNASSNNIRRRIEAYGVDLFSSVVKEESGKKNYDKHGSTINERWEHVDDYVLIQGAKKLGLINKKAAKGLETVNWMRSHASSAHNSDDQVGRDEVIALAMLLESCLFNQPIPDPGHSVSGLFKPVKEIALDVDQLTTLKDQVRCFNQQDLRTAYGFLLECLCYGEEPAFTNAKELLVTAWEMVGEDLKRTAGHNYHNFDIDSNSDKSPDKGSKTRLLEFLLTVDGVKYIPDGTRAKIYRKLARQLADAKNTSYGWGKEVVVANSVQQFGPHVPSIAFEEFYQEVLAIWCGNFYGHSEAYVCLNPFLSALNTDKLRILVSMFYNNERVQEELGFHKPKQRALQLLNWIKERFTIEANRSEVDECIKKVTKL